MAPPYSAEQISEYLDMVGLPAKYHPNASPPVPRDLDFLSRLHAHQLSTVPYENLSLHYRSAAESEGRLHTRSGSYMSLDPAYIFDKFVRRRHGRGGYCFQSVTFFNHVLRGLGFQAYIAMARIRLRHEGVPGGDYIGYCHVVNIVTLPDASRHMVDVGFGGDGPIRPLPLLDGLVTQNIGSQQLRLVRDHIPEQTDKSSAQKLWIYQYRNASGPDVPWNSYYAFSEVEALRNDLEIPNWWCSQNPDSFQTAQVLAVKFLRTAGEGDATAARIYGKVMMAVDTVKRNTGGKTEVIRKCSSEAERLEALRDLFGISLFPEEAAGIEGNLTMIRPAAIN